MHTEQDVSRIVRSWLRTDENASADRVLSDVLAVLDTTPQRRPKWPVRRIGDVQSHVKLGIAAAAVVLVVAVVGLNLLPDPSTVGPPPSPSSSPSPASDADFPPAGAVLGGRHTLSEDDNRFSMEFPAGTWTSKGRNCPECSPGGGILASGHMGLSSSMWFPVWSVDGVYPNPCTHEPGPPVSPSATALADAVAAMSGIEVVTEPTDATIGGRPARHVAIRIPTDIDCEASDFYLWYDDSACAGDEPCYRRATATDSTIRVWIVEVDGAHIWIEFETYAKSPPEVAEKIQQMVDSIELE